MPNRVIIHYHEIGLKGKNRFIFENRLRQNIARALQGEGVESVGKISGRLILKLGEKSSLPEIKNRLQKIFGVAYFCPAFEKTGLKELKERGPAEEFLKNLADEIWANIENKNFASFKIDTKRGQKDFPLTSQEVNQYLGGLILEKSPPLPVADPPLAEKADLLRRRISLGLKPLAEKAKVDLEHPALTIFVELIEDFAFVYFEKIKGPGGLPAGSAGKVIALISSGIDSPVASYELMKRGAEVIFVHFHSYPSTSILSQENVKKIVKVLSNYQPDSKLYLVPFLEIQKEITAKLPLNLGIIFYRRAMFKIAQKIAEREKAKALVTGESLGQVASQTLDNILVIDEASTLPVFRPLIGRDKEEIISLAKQIGTFELSIMPYEDCCSLFIPAHPETKANLNIVKELEKDLSAQAGVNINELIEKATEESKIEIISKK